MARQYRTLNEVMLETLSNPEKARLYLEEIIEIYQETKDLGAFLSSVRHIVDAKAENDAAKHSS